MTLRIQKSDEAQRVVFRLIGRIQAEHVPELQAVFGYHVADHNLILDVKDVKLVDREVVRFLAQLETEGVGLRNCSAFIREWISQERSEEQRATAEQQQL
jgi:anti-anti-sigma regulatory factor